jgi:hypothetical protein
MAALLVLLVLLFAVVAPVAAFLVGYRLGQERGREAASVDERRDLLDRMERAQLSGQTDLLAALGELYRGRDPNRLPPR